MHQCCCEPEWPYHPPPPGYEKRFEEMAAAMGEIVAQQIDAMYLAHWEMFDARL